MFNLKAKVGAIFSKGHIIFFIVSLVLLLLTSIGIIGYDYYTQNIRAVLVIGDVKITQKQYETFISQAEKEKMAENNARNQLIESQKTVIAARKLNISIDDDDRKKVLISKYGLFDLQKANDWQTLNVEVGAINTKVTQAKEESYTGALYEFPFSRNFDVSDLSIAGPDFGKPQAIAADKKYALDQAKSYRDKLVNKTISSTQAVAEIKKDDRLILGSAGNKSKEFTVDKNGFESLDSLNGNTMDKSSIDTLITLKPGDVSEIATKKVFLSYYSENEVKEPKEVMYYFMQLKDMNKPRPNLLSDLQATRKAIKVVENDKEKSIQ